MNQLSTVVQKEDTVEKNIEYYCEGIVSHTDQIDEHNHIIAKDAYNEYISSPNSQITLLFWQHDHTNPQGYIIDKKLTPDGLWIKARLFKNSILCKIAKTSDALHLIVPASVCLHVEKSIKKDNGVLMIMKAKVLEVSGVLIGADPQAKLAFYSQEEIINEKAIKA